MRISSPPCPSRAGTRPPRTRTRRAGRGGSSVGAWTARSKYVAILTYTRVTNIPLWGRSGTCRARRRRRGPTNRTTRPTHSIPRFPSAACSSVRGTSASSRSCLMRTSAPARTLGMALWGVGRRAQVRGCRVRVSRLRSLGGWGSRAGAAARAMGRRPRRGGRSHMGRVRAAGATRSRYGTCGGGTSPSGS